MSETILLTCASGRQCSTLIPLLVEDGSFKLRLAVNSDKSLSKLRSEYPDAEVVQADLTHPDQCNSLLKGVSFVYHVGPPFHPLEVFMGMNMINAAVAESERPGNSFKHFVFSSAIHPEIRKMLNHDRKRYVEEYLIESTLKWTILQPNHFADITVGRMVQLAKDTDPSEEPVYTSLFNTDIVFTYTSLKDMAEVSVKVLKESEKHVFASYPINSTPPMVYSSFIENIGEVLGRKFKINTMDTVKAREMFYKFELGPLAQDPRWQDGVDRMLLYYGKRGLVGTNNIVRWILEREPSSVEDMVKYIQVKSQ